MKTLPAALCLGIVLLVGCGDPDLDDPKTRDKIAEDALPSGWLQKRGPDGERLNYDRDSQIPYTGWVKAMHVDGQVKMLGYCKDGKSDGLWTWWHENGQKWSEIHHKDGKMDGLYTAWHENGQKDEEVHYKNGKKDGLETWWYRDGEKQGEFHYKDGKEDGLHTWWIPSGKKWKETHWKDGVEVEE